MSELKLKLQSSLSENEKLAQENNTLKTDK